MGENASELGHCPLKCLTLDQIFTRFVWKIIWSGWILEGNPKMQINLDLQKYMEGYLKFL